MVLMQQRKPRKKTAQELEAYAAKTLQGRALSIGELKQRLLSRAENPADVEPILSKFKQYGFLNDRKFADAVATSRLENQGLGKARVVRELRQRRVAPTVAQQSVDATFEGVDEVELIEAFLARKFKSVKLPEYLRDEKHLASAYRKLRYAGFGSGNAIRVLKRYAERADELESLEDE
jgi:regulatory protein